MRSFLIILFAALFASGCGDHRTTEHSAESTNTHTVTILDADGTVLLTQNEIIGYNVKTHVMTLIPGQRDKITPSQSLIGGSPFELIVDGESQYSGRFTTSLSSISLNDVVIDLLAPGLEEDQLQFCLGYPSRNCYTAEGDPRENERVIAALTALGKTGG